MIKSLIEIFVISFFKKYAKQFFIGFCLIFSYFIFIQIAGVFLKNTRDFWTLFLSLSIGTEPLFIASYWIFSFVYFSFGMKHIITQCNLSENDFLRFTFNTSNNYSRWSSWLVVISLINAPIIFYCLYSISVSYIIQNDLTGILSFIFLIILSVAEIILLDNLSFKPKRDFSNKVIPPILLDNYPYHTIKFYNILKNSLITHFVIKFLNLFSIFVLFKLMGLDYSIMNLKEYTFLALVIASFTSILLYKDFLFEGSKMLFFLNFPISKFNRYTRIIPFYILVLLPEIVILIAINPIKGIYTTVILLSYLLVFRSIIHCIGNHPMNVVKAISLYFFITLIFILYNFIIPYMIASILFSILTFFKYYQYEKIKFKTDY